MCGRPEPKLVNGEPEEVRADFFNIPFKTTTSNANSRPEGSHEKDNINTILERFCVHTHISQVLRRKTPYFSVAADMTDSKKGKITSLIRSYISLMNAPVPKGAEKTVYTAVFDTGITNFKENLAFTSTYFHPYRTSFGVILGCTEEDVKKATNLLRECGGSWNHRLLLPAVFLDLQRQRLERIRKRHTTRALELQDNFEDVRDYKNGRTPFKFGYHPWTIAECTKSLSELCADSNTMAEDTKIALRQLSRLKRHAEQLAESRDEEPAQSQDEELKKLNKLALDNTRCFLDLFDEISDDIERVSGAVTLNTKAATMTAEEVTSPFFPPLCPKE